MNNIPSAQNQDRQIRRLAAQRQLYSTAKEIFGWQLFISGPVSIAVAVAVLMLPETKAFAALFGLAVVVSDIAWLTPWQKRLRTQAAGVQEAFDCEVLELPWNGIKAGKRPEPELEIEQAARHKEAGGRMPPLTDWYSKDVGELPVHLARLICQRSNCWWDAKQRRLYATLVVAFVAAVSVAMLISALANGLTMEEFFLLVAAPLAPSLLIGYRQYSEQQEAADRIDKLKDHCDKVWGDALDGKSADDIAVKSRSLQDEIFESRKKSPLVFDFIFKKLRSGYESQMNHGSAEYISEAKRVLGTQ